MSERLRRQASSREVILSGETSVRPARVRDTAAVVEHLLEMEVLPFYAQVVVQDAGTVDLPEWPADRAEGAVATPHAVLVATQSDTAGAVLIRVQTDAPEGGTVVLDTTLDLESGILEVGSIVGATLTRVPLEGPGRHRVRITVDPPDLPSRIVIGIEREA